MENNNPNQPLTATAEKIYKKGSFIERLGAFITDQIIIQILLVILFVILKQLDFEIPLLSFITTVVFGTLFIWKAGATPGKMFLKLKVVNSSYQTVNFGYALLRESVGKFLSGFLFGLGFFWVIIDKKKQAWHDKIANTLVIKLDDSRNPIPIENEEPVTIKRKVIFALLYLMFGLPFAIATIFLIVYVFFFRPFQISGQGMYPNYVDGQYYLTNINFGDLARKDVIVLKAPDNPDKVYIKRVIGLPKDRITLKHGNAYINDQLLEESEYLSSDIKPMEELFYVKMKQ